MKHLKIRSLLRDIRRGAGTLPHVGPHPGTPILLGFILLGGVAGLSGGQGGPSILGLMSGSLAAAIPFDALYAAGCIGRARANDSLAARRPGDHSEGACQ